MQLILMLSQGLPRLQPSGNVLVQAIADGVVSDLDEARQIIHRSFDTENFNLKASLELEDMTNRFNQIFTNSSL